ncbi:MAG: hypothetical protein L0I80_08155 [Brevibacterium sp.]|uniref:hypothetical protein n=1 Tax=Brevibacterium sp. TaxID=1701 RepID=UPI0026486FA1|nr:hypothetical protein [Brevibacterium sp.]MDN5807617.1 hypothetical protein [Brevibacterium sp.]MDN5875670.1 hypothetical protein [Brevibacterium sp.]MDN6123825.1 hypothetical protein [Brevibacterium sp.]MDN6174579.1 hypothetical protein [Brevibacterium sp.]MDN6188219.1 hypothetical protein [Brevibacterium sp.]
MTATEADDNAFALTRGWVNIVVAILIPAAALVFYFLFAGHHFSAGTFFSMRSLHDMSDILLAPLIAMIVMLFLRRRPLGRFIAVSYAVLVVTEIAAAMVNDALFARFGYLDDYILPRVIVAVPVIGFFTALLAVFVSGESVLRELAKHRRRRSALV